MTDNQTITEKIKAVQDELKKSGLWKTVHPVWVSHYERQSLETENEFSDWLQFVYLPNLLAESGNHNVLTDHTNVVPQAIKFFGDDVKKGKLLQLLIELDSLS